MSVTFFCVTWIAAALLANMESDGRMHDSSTDFIQPPHDIGKNVSNL